jgi:predicted transcriptional regulator
VAGRAYTGKEATKNPRRVNLYLDETLMAELRKLGEREDRSISWLVRRACKHYMKCQAPKR